MRLVGWRDISPAVCVASRWHRTGCHKTLSLSTNITEHQSRAKKKRFLTSCSNTEEEHGSVADPGSLNRENPGPNPLAAVSKLR